VGSQVVKLNPAYVGDDSFAFVSYSHDDEARVFEEIRWLQDSGVNVWYDARISAGREWSEEIADALVRCSAFVFFVTPNSITSENCRRELNLALEEDRPVVAVHLEPTSLSGGLRLSLSNRQAVLKYRLGDSEYRNTVLHFLGDADRRPEAVPIPPVVYGTDAAPSRSPRRGWPTWAGALILLAFVLAGVWQWNGETESGAAEDLPSIAVLPFADRSANQDSNYFSDGIAEDILNDLAQVPGLVVVARSSSFQYRGEAIDLREVGDELGVGHVLEGSVQRIGDVARINVQLADTESGRQVWSHRFEKEMTDVFAVQTEVAAAVLEALKLEFAVADPVHNISTPAYDAYLHGRHIQTTFGPTEVARNYYLAALALEPEYADAHAGIGWSYIDEVNRRMRPPLEGYAIAQISLLKALAIEPGHVEAQVGASVVDAFMNASYQPSLDLFAELRRLDPGNFRLNLMYSSFITVFGLEEQGLPVLDAWIRVDPLSNLAHRQRARVLIRLGSFDEARAEVAIKADQQGRPDIALEWEIAVAEGNIEEMRRIVESQAGVDSGTAWARRAAYLYATGQMAEMREAANRALTHDPEGLLMLLLLGRDDEAFRIAQSRVAARFTQMTGMLVPRPEGPIAYPSLLSHPDIDRLRKLAGVDDEALAALRVPPL
jgi:TolB-like protein